MTASLVKDIAAAAARKYGLWFGLATAIVMPVLLYYNFWCGEYPSFGFVPCPKSAHVRAIYWIDQSMAALMSPVLPLIERTSGPARVFSVLAMMVALSFVYGFILGTVLGAIKGRMKKKMPYADGSR